MHGSISNRTVLIVLHQQHELEMPVVGLISIGKTENPAWVQKTILAGQGIINLISPVFQFCKAFQHGIGDSFFITDYRCVQHVIKDIFIVLKIQGRIITKETQSDGN